MKILPGKNAVNWKEAVALALQTAGAEGMSADIIDMFVSITRNDKAIGESDKIISSTIRSRYGSKATWQTERWCVPVPHLSYDSKDISQLIIEITVYLVTAVAVKTPQDSRLITLVGGIGKPETLVIPMVFLHAVLERDLGRFSIIARNIGYTTWEVPGAGSVRVPNGFINELTEILKHQSVVAWLGKFGFQGRSVAPLVAGSLLGLAFQDSTKSILMNREIVTTDNLVSALENMAYQPTEAREMVRLTAPRLRADMTLEEAIRITLQMGKGGDLP